MKFRVLLMVVLCTLVIFVLSCDVARKSHEIEAWVEHKNPNAKIIQKIGPGESMTYVLCEKNILTIVSTRKLLNNEPIEQSITGQKALVIPESCTCEELQKLNPYK